MKFNRIVKEDYSRLLGQIDSLKTNISQLLHTNQDSQRTVKAGFNRRSKSPRVSHSKTNRIGTQQQPSRTSGKKDNQGRCNKENVKTEGREGIATDKLLERMIEVEQSNQEMKRQTLILEEMLRIEREKCKKLEKQLKASRQKRSVGTQKELQPKRSSSFKVFTPLQSNNKQSLKRKDSKTRDEGDIQSFLLVDCDDFAYSPKKRNIGQIEIMEMMQQISRPGPFERREEMKGKLLEAVKKFIRK